MQIEIKLADEIPVKYGEKEFKVRRPKVGVVRALNNALKAADDGAKVDLMIGFCAQVGVPQDVAEDWDMDQLSSFFNQLSSSEKKS